MTSSLHGPCALELTRWCRPEQLDEAFTEVRQTIFANLDEVRHIVIDIREDDGGFLIAARYPALPDPDLEPPR